MTSGTSTKLTRTPRLDQEARKHIGAHLRVAFEEFRKEPIPDEQVHLLLALRQKDRERRQTKLESVLAVG